MADAYYYSSSAGAMSLVGTVTGDATSITVDDVSGLPASVPFKLVLDPGLSTEEIVKVTVVAGTTLTVVRGWDGTSGQAHANLATVRHMVTAEDLRLSREHEDSSSEVHGVTGSVVGTNDTQALTNKDLTSATNTFPSSLATDVELAAHAADGTAVHGITGSVVGTTDAQTLTGKTMSGADNSFSAIPQTAVTGLTTDIADLEAADTALDGRVDTLELDEAVTSGVLVAAAGWTIDAQEGRRLGGKIAEINFTATRTGADIFSGNLTNVLIATVAAGWKPGKTVGVTPSAIGDMWSGTILGGGDLYHASTRAGISTGGQISGSALYMLA
jgi:hypothetical protein